jgi:glycine oxidase
MGSPDVIVIGGGVIGLACAIAVSRRGIRSLVLTVSSPGEASALAAGMLAPSVERSEGPAHAFAVASRDMYPAYVAGLEEETGISIPLNRLGVLQVAVSLQGVRGLKSTMPSTAQWLQPRDLVALEPSLGHAHGAILNPHDGCVDNVALLQALRARVDAASHVAVRSERVRSVAREGEGVTIHCEGTGAYHAKYVIVAAGAWASLIDGLPFAAAVEPVRGQLVAFATTPLRHVIYGPRGYLVPRTSGITIAGSTMERVGFDAATTPEGLSLVHSAAVDILPSLGQETPARTWAGLRPVTPDGLPLLGPEPHRHSVIYACGHGRNGVLLAPATATVVAELVAGEQLSLDVSQFRPDRFSDRFRSL